MSIDFAPHDMTSNSSHSPFIASVSSYYSGDFMAKNAFNASITSPLSYWVASTSTGWLMLFTGGNRYVLNSYAIAANTIPEPSRMPKNFTMQISDDGVTWVIADTRTNQTSWGSGEIRAFDCASPTVGRYFKLNVTANNGDGVLVVQELYLYGDVASAPACYLKGRNRNRTDFRGVSLSL